MNALIFWVGVSRTDDGNLLYRKWFSRSRHATGLGSFGKNGLSPFRAFLRPPWCADRKASRHGACAVIAPTGSWRETSGVPARSGSAESRPRPPGRKPVDLSAFCRLASSVAGDIDLFDESQTHTGVTLPRGVSNDHEARDGKVFSLGYFPMREKSRFASCHPAGNPWEVRPLPGAAKAWKRERHP